VFTLFSVISVSFVLVAARDVKLVFLGEIEFLVHGQVAIIFVVSVCLSVCLFVCAVFLSCLRSNLDQTRTHVTCPGLVVSPVI